jgi:hypothetical protein
MRPVLVRTKPMRPLPVRTKPMRPLPVRTEPARPELVRPLPEPARPVECDEVVAHNARNVDKFSALDGWAAAGQGCGRVLGLGARARARAANAG